MIDNLKEYLSRKRTKDVLLATAVLILMDKLGVSAETMYAVAGLYGVKIGGQSYSDGQEAASHKTVLNVVEVPPLKPT